MKLTLIIQARTGSTRLPGKALRKVMGRPLLALMLERVRAARMNAGVVVATTWNDADDAIDRLCRELQVEVFRGHPTDLLDRHYQVGRLHKADAVAKIPSDCPLIDPSVIETVVDSFVHAAPGIAMATNLCPPSWPDGNDVEVVCMDALHQAWQEADRAFEREHTTPFIWTRPERFHIHNVQWNTGLNLWRDVRLTLDYEEDFELIRAVYERLYSPPGKVFSLQEVLALLQKEPELARLNRKHLGHCWQLGHTEELGEHQKLGGNYAT